MKKKPLTHQEVSSRGGKARAKKYSKKELSEIMKKVVQARYKKMSTSNDIQNT